MNPALQPGEVGSRILENEVNTERVKGQTVPFSVYLEKQLGYIYIYMALIMYANNPVERH